MPQPYLTTEIDGQVIQFAVAPQSLTGEQPTDLMGSGIRQLEKIPAEEILAKIRALGTLVLQAKESLPRPPSEISVEFGLTVDFTAGVLISSGSVGAHMTVAFKWVSQEQRDGEGAYVGD